MMRRQLSTLLLAAAVVVPFVRLWQLQDRPVLMLTGVIAAILVAFTVLIKGVLMRRGAPSAGELLGRTVTFWWMLAGFLIAVTTPPIVAFTLMGLLCWISWHEYLSLVPHFAPLAGFRLGRLPAVVGILAVAAAAACAYALPVAAFLALVPMLVVGVLSCAFVMEDRTEGALSALGYLALGQLYFVFGLGHGLLILKLGAMVLIYGVFLTEMRDLISYWVGKGLAVAQRKRPQSGALRLLNHKIAPKVSPNKGWGAGVIAALFIAALAVALLPLLPAFPHGQLSVAGAAILGGIVGVLGLFGDLVFSMLKRDLRVKDSGSALPGGTGVIDRIDGLVFTLPAVFHLIYWQLF